jgi:hypothetical protein
MVLFFHETLFRGYSLAPTDMLNQLLLPYGRNVRHISVQNHYTLDVIEQDVPWGQFWQQSVRRGELPLWNPAIFGGQPHLATSMAGVFSPFRLLYLVLPAERALSLGIVAGLMCAALFMYLFLQEIGRSPVAAFVGGAAWALNTAMLMWYWRLPGVMAWVPLTLWSFERAQRLQSVRWLMATSLSLGLAWLGGNVQSACHVALICGCYFIFAAEDHRHMGSRLVLVLAVAVALAAIQWLPTLELMHWDRTGRVETAGPRWSLQHTLLGTAALVTFVFPGLAGSTATFDLLKAVPASMGDFTGCIGLAASVMAVLGFVGARDRRQRALWIAAALAIVIVLFTPFVRYLYHRLLIVVVFAMCVSASYGIDLWLDSPRDKLQLIRCLFGGALTVAVLLLIGLAVTQLVIGMQRAMLLSRATSFLSRRAGDTFFGNNQDWLRARVTTFLDHYRPSNPVFWLPVACLVAVVIAGWRRRWMRTVFVVASMTELVLLGRLLVPQVDLNRYPLYPPLQPLEAIRAEAGLFRVLNYAPHLPTFLPSNFLMAYGFAASTGYESLAPANLHYLPVQEGTNFNPLLDLQNVRFVVCPDTTDLPAPRFTLTTEGNGVRVFRNASCLPRVQLLTRWEVVASREAARARMLQPDFRPSELVVLEQRPTISTGFPLATSAVTEIKRYTPRQVVIHASSCQPSILLLADTWYPGWRATVDGKRTAVLRADAVLRAVELPRGEHVVEFRYEPTSFRIGAAVSGTGLVAALFVIAAWRKFAP